MDQTFQEGSIMEFKNIEITSKAIIEKYTKYKYDASETSFTTMFAWKDYLNMQYAEICGFLVVTFRDGSGNYKTYMPYGDGNLKDCTQALCNHFSQFGQKLKIISANEEMAKTLKEIYPEIKVKENIDFEDYVYTSESLINLSGKKLHSKKNHLNTFKNTYNYTYRKMTENDFDECLNLGKKLMIQKNSKDSLDYKMELKSMEVIFEHFNDLELCGGLITIDDKIAAFSVGEKLNDNCALIQIEKADTQYKGIYVAINNEFVKNEWSNFEFVNREEDMGIEGLRKAKLSYRPHHMVKKYICEF